MSEPDLPTIRNNANAGDVTAQYQMGNIYQQGLLGELPNTDEAINDLPAVSTANEPACPG
jgi:hypothetical protein